MPCESCHVQFTVFRRKRSCPECKRFYCSGCLSSVKRNSRALAPLCERCAIFAKRPLLRADLLKLKPKDLIFYLQSKHISTAGCVEKDELVGLVLSHVQQTDATSPTGSARSHTDPTNSFDSLKQSCQNFFTNISDNISDSFASFENKVSTKSGQSFSTTDNSSSVRVSDQPRVSTREIPTYAASQNGRMSLYEQTQVQPQAQSQASPASPSSPPSTSLSSPPRTAATTGQLSIHSQSNTTTSPSVTGRSSHTGSPVASPSTSTPSHQAGTSRESDERKNDDMGKSECECSDDELFATFIERTLKKTNLSRPNGARKQKNATTLVTGANRPEMTGEISSQSSFEELGAIGGVSDDSKAATDTNSSNIDQWQILDIQPVAVGDTNFRETSETEQSVEARKKNERQEDVKDPTVIKASSSQQQTEPLPLPLPFLPPTVPQRVKKVSRRRSDGYLNRRRPRDDDYSPVDTATSFAQTVGTSMTLDEQNETEIADAADAADVDDSAAEEEGEHNGVGNCQRCGKNKSSLKRQVERMRQHLENSELSEVDIKRDLQEWLLELQDFLIYLEKRTKSTDSVVAATAASPLDGVTSSQAVPNIVNEEMDENEGIHVYGSATTSTGNNNVKDSRFINIDDFNSLQELECLSVKQLKEILMLNRVDYKGCCEKQELLERVGRLWKHLKSTPAVDKLQSDELCKICMDAAIECVILECGHMATCTNCGKVLSECPICRQYVVRVVRFFRA